MIYKRNGHWHLMMFDNETIPMIWCFCICFQITVIMTLIDNTFDPVPTVTDPMFISPGSGLLWAIYICMAFGGFICRDTWITDSEEWDEDVQRLRDPVTNQNRVLSSISWRRNLQDRETG